MNNIFVRKATIKDVEDIMNIHRSCDDPWHNQEDCLSWMDTRLSRNFYIQLGIYNNTVVGHGEWIISSEPENKYLYLGMLQIDTNYQRRGIGRKMLEDGMLYAKESNCKYISVICGEDDPIEFYRKCGFVENRKIIVSTLSTTSATKDSEFEIIESAPEKIINEISFKFGHAQTASRHMWEVCNRKPITNRDRLTPAMRSNNNDYIQLSYFAGNKSGIVLCWSNSSDLKRLINASLYFGKTNGLDELIFYYDIEYVKTFHSGSQYAVELIMPFQ